MIRVILTLTVKTDKEGLPVMSYKLYEKLIDTLYACKRVQPLLSITYSQKETGSFTFPLCLENNYSNDSYHFNKEFLSYNFDFGCKLEDYFDIAYS